MVVATITCLSEDEHQMIKTLGDGNVSRGLRKALDVWLESKDAGHLCGGTASAKLEVSKDFGDKSKKEATTFLTRLITLSEHDEWVKQSKIAYTLNWPKIRIRAAVLTLLANSQIEQKIVKTKTAPSVQFRVAPFEN